jgi:tRNA threonylcarbamoyl adenosine modification protein (Sua5/YciO/YrdC/YwlC family)
LVVPVRVIDPEGPVDEAVVAEVAARLGAGECVVVPTDTVYGLAARLADPGAVGQLWDLKGRARSVPIAVLVVDAAQAATIASLGEEARGLAEAHWPGALTLVVEGAPGVGTAVGSDDGSVGVRAPNLAFVRAVAARVGPLATTSANLSGEATPEQASAVAALFPDVDLVVDGGPCRGEPSTVVDARVDPVRVIRQGPIRLD